VLDIEGENIRGTTGRDVTSLLITTEEFQVGARSTGLIDRGGVAWRRALCGAAVVETRFAIEMPAWPSLAWARVCVPAV
jgi:hypothetical protein